MSEINTQVLQDGQLAIRTVVQNGAIVSGTSSTDITALVQTNEGKQLALKTVLVNGGAAMEWVNELPATGQPNTMYLVPSGNTREGYAVFQQFVWNATDQEWAAMGAFDTTIVQQGLVYQESFNTSTNTWTVRVNQAAN